MFVFFFFLIYKLQLKKRKKVKHNAWGCFYSFFKLNNTMVILIQIILYLKTNFIPVYRAVKASTVAELMKKPLQDEPLLL